MNAQGLSGTVNEISLIPIGSGQLRIGLANGSITTLTGDVSGSGTSTISVTITNDVVAKAIHPFLLMGS